MKSGCPLRASGQGSRAPNRCIILVKTGPSEIDFSLTTPPPGRSEGREENFATYSLSFVQLRLYFSEARRTASLSCPAFRFFYSLSGTYSTRELCTCTQYVPNVGG